MSIRNFFLSLFLLISLPTVLHAATQEILLEKLSPNAVMTLNCASDEQALDVPIPDRWTVTKMSIRIRYTSSNNLVGNLAQIVLKANGIPVAQTKLNTTTPETDWSVAVPVTHLKPGYNRISLQTVLHVEIVNAGGCEKPCTPDMWTTINLHDSALNIEYTEKPVPLSLSSISGFVFDPKTFPEANVNLVAEDRSADALTVLNMTASGIARKYDYRKVNFTVSRDLQPDMDNVLIGRKSFVNSFLGAHGLGLGTTDGGFLKIFHMPAADGKEDQNHALLVVTGEQYDHVKLAAETLANMSYGFPGAQELSAHSIKLPNVPEYGGREVIRANETYEFRTLNFPTTTFKGINPAGRVINFRLPVDFLIRQNLNAKLKLHFAYGAGMRDTSALNIVVNEKTVRAIHLGDKDGGFFEDYVVEIPTYLFKPGSNTISFGVEMQPNLKECDVALLGNLFLTIFDNSTLTFPDMPHFVQLPKLELFMLNGFPFTRWPDGYETKIYLTDTDDSSVAAMLNVTGLITQKNGFPLLGMQVDPDPPNDKWKGELFIIGSPGKVPKEFKERSPIFVGDHSQIPYPVVRDWEGEYTLAYSTQTSQLGAERGYMMQFESPYMAGRSVMVMAAEGGASLQRLSRVLMDTEVQAQAQGGLMLVETGEQFAKPRVTSFGTGALYTTGKSGTASKVESFLYDHPYFYYATVALVTLGLALGLFWALQRYRAGRKLGRSSGK